MSRMIPRYPNQKTARGVKFYNFIVVMTFMMIIGSLVLLNSCASVKKTSKNDVKETEKTEISRIKDETTTTNSEIKDRIEVEVPVFDPETKAKVDLILSQLNTSKSSGQNSYKSTYDAETNKLIIDYFIGKTQEKEVLAVTETVVEKTFEERIDEYVKKIVVPWWAYLILAYILRKQIFGILTFIHPPISVIFSKRNV